MKRRCALMAGGDGFSDDECKEEVEDMCEAETCKKIPGVSVRLMSDDCSQPRKSRCPPGSVFTDCQPMNKKKKDCSSKLSFVRRSCSRIVRHSAETTYHLTD